MTRRAFLGASLSALLMGGSEVRARCDAKIRGFHVVSTPLSLSGGMELLDALKVQGFNLMVLGLRGGIDFDSYSVPGAEYAMRRSDLRQLADHARDLGVQFIPEIKLLTHQEHLFKNSFPSGMFNLTTYDPHNERVRDVIESVLEELVELTGTDAVHIGHDEVAGITPYSRRRFLKKGEMPLPASMFLESVLWANAQLERLSVKTWMWGDMLLSPAEFPEMPKRNLHGSLDGYGKMLRQAIPKDIVICDWRYHHLGPNFPTVDTLLAEGFDVVGSSYLKPENIEQLTAVIERSGGLGMLATSWDFVQHRSVKKLITHARLNSEIFNRYLGGSAC